MLGNRGRRARVHVRGRAHLERDPPVAHERREAPELDRAVLADVDVVDEPDAVAEALGATPLERLPDRRQPERLASVDRDVEVLPPDVLECVEVARRAVALLGPRDVEPDDAGVPPAHGALGDLDGSRCLAHRGDDDLHGDRATVGRRPVRADPEPLEVRLDHLVERQPTLGRKLRGVADLRIDDAVGGEVLCAFRRHPHDRVALLHDADGVGERLEVELERLAIGAPADPPRELGRIGRGQPAVAVLGRQVDDRLGAEATVEVIVEERLGGLADGLERDHDAST